MVWMLLVGCGVEGEPGDTATEAACEPVECPPNGGTYQVEVNGNCERCTAGDEVWWSCVPDDGEWTSARIPLADEGDDGQFRCFCITQALNDPSRCCTHDDVPGCP